MAIMLVVPLLLVFASALGLEDPVTKPVYKLILLGQTGMGKSTLAEAIARHLGYSKKRACFYII